MLCKTLVALVLCVLGSTGRAADAPMVEKYLHAGELAKGEQALERALDKSPKDDQVRFGLGVLRFVRAIESASTAAWYGLSARV